MCASFTYIYHSTLVLSADFSSDYMSYLRRWRHTYQSCCASSWSLMSFQTHRVRLFQDMVVKCKQAFCLEDVYSFLFSRCTSLVITKLFSKKNTIQLYCLCVEKFAFWLIIYIKTFNNINNKTSTTHWFVSLQIYWNFIEFIESLQIYWKLLHSDLFYLYKYFSFSA